MAHTIVVYVRDGQIRRIATNGDLDLKCIVVYADVPKADRGQPWVKDIVWPSSQDRQTVLIEGVTVESDLPEVEAVVHLYDEIRSNVLNLLRPAAQDAPKTPTSD